MTNAELDRAISLYLGGDSNCGEIYISGGEGRIREAFPKNSEAVISGCVEFIEKVMADDHSWMHEDLGKVGSILAELLPQRYPWLSSITIAKLANYYCYRWK